jgi:TM2 domain-containing membrane protein YozV
MNNKTYTLELFSIYNSIAENRRDEFLRMFVERQKNPVASFGWNAWLGMLGADKFYNGQALLGIIKLITFGGFGIWVIVDWFMAGGVSRDKNIESARSIRESMRG